MLSPAVIIILVSLVFLTVPFLLERSLRTQTDPLAAPTKWLDVTYVLIEWDDITFHTASGQQKTERYCHWGEIGSMLGRHEQGLGDYVAKKGGLIQIGREFLPITSATVEAHKEIRKSTRDPLHGLHSSETITPGDPRWDSWVGAYLQQFL
jgi:hypothetical protein